MLTGSTRCWVQRQTETGFDAREHHEPWPGGRSNHYLFDLNRDWAWQVQKESRQRYKVYREWFPHVHVDYHEQSYNAPYYFAPAAEPFHEAITDWQREFQTTIGENHMRYFDEENWLYFTRERFDLFYPSYGDTWPTFHGSIGMTYEMPGHSLAGLAIKKREGDILTLRQRLLQHHTTGMSTVEITSIHADRVIEEFREFFNRSQNDPDSRYKTFVVKADNNRDKIYNLLNDLDTRQIEYGRAGSSASASGFDFSTGEITMFRLRRTILSSALTSLRETLCGYFLNLTPNLQIHLRTISPPGRLTTGTAWKDMHWKAGLIRPETFLRPISVLRCIRH
jgi:hypothetical protein